MSNRRDGIMPTLSGSTFPKRMIFFDTETYIIEKESGEIDFPFRLGAAIYIELSKKGAIKKRVVYPFYDKKQFIDFIIDCEHSREHLYIFAHNIAFDLRVLDVFMDLINRRYGSEPPIINNLVFIWTLKSDSRKIIFMDTANLGVQSVSELGNDIGFPKLDIDFYSLDNEKLMEYCIRDVEILETFVLNYIRFIRTHNLGSFKITLASQAMTAFRTSFYNEDIHIHSHNGSINLERDAYFGGRTEIFRYGYVGQQDYYMLDVNSMYPHAMTNYPIPTQLLEYKENVEPEYLLEQIKSHYVIADIDLETDENFIPIRLSKHTENIGFLHNPHNLPYPKPNNNRIIFPIGKFRAVLHHQELLYLIENGYIHKVHRMTTYEIDKPFNDYVNHFYTLKAQYKVENNPSWRFISKLFLNTLYGKFGQLEPQRKKIGYNTEDRFHRLPFFNIDEGVFAQDLTWNWRVFREFKKGETTFSNPAIAGSITANARIYLYNLFTIAGKSNVFYTDTDSLIVNALGYQNLLRYMSKTEIGMLDLQKKGRRLVIRGNKDYRMDDKLVHKGISKSANKVGLNLWRYVQFEGFISAWKSGNISDMKGQYRTKSRKGDYEKGIIDENNIVYPFTLIEF